MYKQNISDSDSNKNYKIANCRPNSLFMRFNTRKWNDQIKFSDFLIM